MHFPVPTLPAPGYKTWQLFGLLAEGHSAPCYFKVFQPGSNRSVVPLSITFYIPRGTAHRILP